MDLSILKGSDHAASWPLAGVEDFSGWTVKAQVRRAPTSPVVLHEWSNEIGNASLEGSSVQLATPAAVSSAWTWWDGYYDVELLEPDGHVHRVAEGLLWVQPEVTSETPPADPVQSGTPVRVYDWTVQTVSPEAISGAVQAYLETNSEAVLGTHISSLTPHPVYDDLPSLTLLFENGLA